MKKIFPGFTLIELLIVGTILILVSLIITQITIVTIRANIKVEKMRSVKQAGDFAIDTINRLLSPSIVHPSSGGFTCAPDGYDNFYVPFTYTDNDQSYGIQLLCKQENETSPSSLWVDGDQSYALLGNTVTLINASGGISCSGNPVIFTCFSSDAEGRVPQKIRIRFSLSPWDISHTVDTTMKMDFTSEIVMRNKQDE